ncbi:hypothetical protein SSX86_001436 [Deinandra increscens subsp. villosa]|uniref:Uncharacterized protein n=1 Tax=Deinandra increscens subsp. villosa TaxID=3103831 RepID=A0AAP0DZ26_9ASTR
MFTFVSTASSRNTEAAKDNYRAPSKHLFRQEKGQRLAQYEFGCRNGMRICDQIYEFCSASFWFHERLKSGPMNERPKYATCCKSGKVRIKYPVNPPSTITEIFSNRTFLRWVRSYDSMFAMTALGATIDESKQTVAITGEENGNAQGKPLLEQCPGQQHQIF